MAPEEILVAEGLVLRRMRPSDAPRILAAVERSLPELRRFMPWAMQTPTLESVGEYLKGAWAPPENMGFGLVDAGAVVGAFGLHARRGPGILEIGYWVRSDCTGRGYATAGAGALTTAAFEHFAGVDRVEIRCDPANLASARVAEKLGYRLDRTETVDVEAAAQTGEQQVWAVDRASWAAEPRVTWRPSAGKPARPAVRTPR